MPVTSIAFSPNGRQLATGSGDKAARVWDLSTGMLSALLEVCSMGRGLHPPSPPSALIAGVHRRCLSNFREGGDPCAVHLTTDLEATLLATDRTEEWYNGALCILKYRPLLASSPRSGPLQRRLQHRLQSRWAAAGHWQHGQDGEGVGLVLHQTCSIA